MHHDVFELDVAMHHAGLVCGTERRNDLRSDVQQID